MSQQATSRGTFTPRQAVDRLREVAAGGELGAWLTVDAHSGELSRPEARALFTALPAVTPATSPEELVENGLVTSLPRGLRRALELPRYRPGREIFVRTNVALRRPERHRPVGAYAPSQPEGLTHRAVLKAHTDARFLVALEGAPSLLSFDKAQVFAWNEPIGVPPAGGNLSGVLIDYNDPAMKAHVCAGYIDVARSLPEIDFANVEAAAQAQSKLIYAIANRVRMTYAGRGEGYSGARAGALLSGGQGVSFVQRAVAAGLLSAFSRVLAFDLQVGIGRTLRLGAPHGFLVLTLRPSLDRYVVDPAWGEPLTDLRVAFFDEDWGHDRCLLGFEGLQEVRVPPSAIDLPRAEAA